MTLAEEKALLARFAKTAGAGGMLNIYEAGELGIDRAVKLLDATLQEEKKTDAANSACGHGHQPYGWSGLRRV